MIAKPFLDASILLYAVALDQPKAEIAVTAMAGGGSTSVHVLDEFASVCRRTLRLSWPEIEAAVFDILLICPDPLRVDMATHRAAVRIASRYGYSFHGALVIAGALEAESPTLLSETMQHGQVIDGALTIRNPFVVN